MLALIITIPIGYFLLALLAAAEVGFIAGLIINAPTDHNNDYDDDN